MAWRKEPIQVAHRSYVLWCKPDQLEPLVQSYGFSVDKQPNLDQSASRLTHHLVSIYEHEDGDYLKRLQLISQMVGPEVEELLLKHLKQKDSDKAILESIKKARHLPSEESMAYAVKDAMFKNLKDPKGPLLAFDCPQLTKAILDEFPHLDPKEVRQLSVEDEIPLPFSDETFGLCVLNMVLHSLDPMKIEPLLKDIRRVMKADGYVIFREHDLTPNQLIESSINLWYQVQDEEPPKTYLSSEEWSTLFHNKGLTAKSNGSKKATRDSTLLDPNNPLNVILKHFKKTPYGDPTEWHDTLVSLKDTLFKDTEWKHSSKDTNLKCQSRGGPKQYFDLIRELPEDTPRLKYTPGYQAHKVVHWGQKKLMYSEIEFLLWVEEQIGQVPLVMVYVGAASGTHLIKMSEMFPQVKFHLYDKAKFNSRLRPPQFKIYQQYFLDKDAHKWKKFREEHSDQPLVLVSDIRTASWSTMDAFTVEKQVKQDQDWQMNWHQIMGPDFSMFKFRLPWDDGQTEYLRGKDRLQIYPGHNSTETRLWVEKGAPLVMYDNRKHEEQLAFFNRVLRVANYHNPLDQMTLEERKGTDNCTPMDDRYDAAAEAILLEAYLKSRKLPHDPASIWALHCSIDKSLGGKPPKKTEAD